MSRIQAFFSQWLKSLATFPIANVILGVMTLLIMYMIHYSNGSDDMIMKIMAACIVALPLSIIGPLRAILIGKQTSIATRMQEVIGLVIGGIFYMCLPFDFQAVMYSEQVIIIGTIALARTMPFFAMAMTKKNNEISVRLWRREFVGAMILGAVAGGIVRGGISACIASLHYLFDIYVGSNAYGYVGAFAMIFVAGGITLIHLVNQDSLDTAPKYTRTMRIFGHYIFFPLTIVYGCILLSYGIKILISGTRPQGLITYMVIGYVLFGLMTWYATYPALPNKTLQKAHNILFISFILTSFLMIKAIWMRIDQYGVTVERYLICAIIVWIISTSITCLSFSKHRLLIMISTLVLFGAFSIYAGPRNAFNTATRSQYNILMSVVTKNNITTPLGSGSLTHVSSGDATIAYNAIAYLSKDGETKRATNLLPQSELSGLQYASQYYGRTAKIAQYLGIPDNYGNYNTSPGNNEEYFSLSKQLNNTLLSVEGYKTVLAIDGSNGNNNGIIQFTYSGAKYNIDIKPYGQAIYAKYIIDRDNTNHKQYTPNTTQEIQYDVNQGFTFSTGNIQVILTDVSGTRSMSQDNTTGSTESGTSYTINYYRGYVLIK